MHRHELGAVAYPEHGQARAFRLSQERALEAASGETWRIDSRAGGLTVPLRRDVEGPAGKEKATDLDGACLLEILEEPGIGPGAGERVEVARLDRSLRVSWDRNERPHPS
jgi:hypothetical protein